MAECTHLYCRLRYMALRRPVKLQVSLAVGIACFAVGLLLVVFGIAEGDVGQFQIPISGGLRAAVNDRSRRLLLRVLADQLFIDPQTNWMVVFGRIVRLGRAFTFLTFAGMCRSLLGENTTRMLHFKRKNHWEAPISALTQIGPKTGHAWVGSFWGNKRRATDAPSRIIL